MENWDEIRTAYQVARIGTVSGAADVLGVHHATVIRHIDALEKRLGARLFQRHARGYTPTEAGNALLSVAQTTEEQFSQLVSRIKGQGETVSGELVITAVGGFSELIVPVLAQFQRQYPDVIVRFITDIRLFRLDYGEAHVAIRAGGSPEEPDNVVQPLIRLQTALYASKGYIAKHGMPSDEADLANHAFIGPDNPESRAPFHRWIRASIPKDRVVFRATDSNSWEAAVAAGVGLGFLSHSQAARMSDLVCVAPARAEWEVPLWLVSHVDLHRTRKVQAILTAFKEAAKEWAKICPQT